MRRVVCEAFGDPLALRVVEEPTPWPGPGEVLIEPAAVSASFVDGLVVRGAYQVRPPLPFTPGTCVAGRVAAVGDGVETPPVGTTVAAVLSHFGGYTSHIVVPAEVAVPVPGAVSVDVAAAMESYLTLAFATTHRITIEAGDHVVVLGASGGIGSAAVDTARSLGAHVIAVASTEDKRAAAKETGADVVLGYDNLKDDIRTATDGGADVVIDPVGGPAAESALRALAPGGRFCVLGFASGDIPRLPSNIVLLRNRSVIGIDWGHWSREAGGTPGNAKLLADVLANVARGRLHPGQPSTAPLTDAGRVLQLFGERRAVGRYVLHP
ncbi:NADPH:quinone oxidoreductase family protein [Amycolatopsis pithecellobii]|uniref:Zinc-binding dehydrogenase n=1 Tax=Amycolatopsis pithecellobii TaxID=664692 RepID=A0A6N7YZE4_9PSEU|nr:NADPH:quinone oxidoreductase family protein [Amycolatopsis pithecellobii]MTD53789.1 zinc-binding dehydrogenase [Amycolatopsis pithecellobii]